MKKINSGYLFLFSFLTVFIITPLFQKGVFGDGLMYLTVAYNRFKGYGSFWQQHYTDTSMPFFREQPPLYFESLSWFYKFFNGSFFGDKVFTILLLFSTIFLISAIWNKLNASEKKYKSLSWLPSILLLTVGVFSWTYSNQVIETMVVPLSLLVFYLHLVFIQTENKIKKFISFSGIVLFLFLLLLTKGIQSVFLLSALFFAGISCEKKSFKKLMVYILLLFIVFVGVCFFVFFYNEKAHFWLTNYFDKRLIGTFHHVGATTEYHEKIILRYFGELLPVFILLFLISIYFKIKYRYSFFLQWKHIKQNKIALWLILISLSASLPLSLTLEQRGFYLTPSFPFIILGLTLLYKKYFFILFSKLFMRRKKILLAVAGVFALSALLFFCLFKNDYKRDEGIIKDCLLLKKMVPQGNVIGIDSSMWIAFSVHSYLNMQNNNSLSVSDTTKFFLMRKDRNNQPPKNYERLNLKTNWMDIYARIEKKN